jgi:hypothetical protein
MTKKLKACFLSLLVTLVTVFSAGCTAGISSLLDATAVQLETSLISGMNNFLTFVMYKAFGVYDQALQLGAV